MNTEHPDETRFWERVARFTAEQWRHILDAYVAGREDDPLLKECREVFNKPERRLPEDEYGFLHAALVALGEPTYRPALLPFGAMLLGDADKMAPSRAAELRCCIEVFEAWCVAPESVNDDREAFTTARAILDFDEGRDDQVFACMQPLWFCFSSGGGGGLGEGAEDMMLEMRQRRDRRSRPGLDA